MDERVLSVVAVRSSALLQDRISFVVALCSIAFVRDRFLAVVSICPLAAIRVASGNARLVGIVAVSLLHFGSPV